MRAPAHFSAKILAAAAPPRRRQPFLEEPFRLGVDRHVRIGEIGQILDARRKLVVGARARVHHREVRRDVPRAAHRPRKEPERLVVAIEKSDERKAEPEASRRLLHVQLVVGDARVAVEAEQHLRLHVARGRQRGVRADALVQRKSADAPALRVGDFDHGGVLRLRHAHERAFLLFLLLVVVEGGHQALASIAKQTRSRPDAPVARRLAPVALALASRAAARAAPAPV
mmetsp:Transcript_11237/g.33932  ORF Transcript_11237/g.33932 Transcript_11237/m.33932 type:complete len:228 (+) Transcript_11237:183-866(+)